MTPEMREFPEEVVVTLGDGQIDGEDYLEIHDSIAAAAIVNQTRRVAIYRRVEIIEVSAEVIIRERR